MITNKQEKVFCSKCKYCFKQFNEYRCNNIKTAEKTKDNFFERGGKVNWYRLCKYLNENNDCKYFKKRNYKNYISLFYLNKFWNMCKYSLVFSIILYYAYYAIKIIKLEN